MLIAAFGGRLIPDRGSSSLPADLSSHAATLAAHYGLDQVTHLRVPSDSTLVDAPRADWDLQGYPSIEVATVLDGATSRPASHGQVRAGDRLTVVGDRAEAQRFAVDHGLIVEALLDATKVADVLVGRTTGVAEVVIPPRSRFVGETVRPGHVVAGGALVILAVHRRGRRQGDSATDLQAGDSVLMEGPWESLDAIVTDDGLLVVDRPDLLRRQAVPLGRGSGRAIAILMVMIVLLATNAVPAVVATLLAAGMMILSRVLTVTQAYRHIHWSTVLLIAGMIPLSVAIRTSGAGELVADVIVDGVRDYGPHALLLALFTVTVMFGQLISNTATALVMIPIAVSAAAQLDVSARPVLMCVCVASAASFSPRLPPRPT